MSKMAPSHTRKYRSFYRKISFLFSEFTKFYRLLDDQYRVQILNMPSLVWTPKEMMGVKTISDIQLSPYNDFALFVVTENVMTQDKSLPFSQIYQKNLKTSEVATPLIESRFSSSQARYSPNGKWIAFVSDCNGIKRLYLTNEQGKKPTCLTPNNTYDVQTFTWSQDSQKIAFVMRDTTQREKKDRKTSDAYFYHAKTEIDRLWLIEVFLDTPISMPLTPDEYSVRGYGDAGSINVEFDWSSDGKNIVFAYSPGIGFDYFHIDSHLAIVNVADQQITQLEKKARYEAHPRYSSDGKWIAYLSDDSCQAMAINRQIAIRSTDGKIIRYLAPTSDEHAFLIGPHLLGWTSNDQEILFFEPKGTQFHISFLSIDGKNIRELETKGHFFKDPSLSYDKSTLAFVLQAPETPPEAYFSFLEPFEPKPISQLNQRFLKYPKIKTEKIHWKSTDQQMIEGLITYPVDYQKNHLYPLLVVIHGGPMIFFDETFLGMPLVYPLAALAQEGFMILRVNPRGSCGYGKSFRCANYQDWGGMDFIDIMKGVDSLIEKNKVDPDQLGVMGWSYGGYMTAWAITQTSRFKAASVGAGLSNLVSANGTTDIHRFFTHYLGEFSHNVDFYHKRSPINYVANITTPCLIQHGLEDKRVPVSQGKELYHALHRIDKKVELILYPNTKHKITDPKMLLDAMEMNLEWFKSHVLKTRASFSL